MVDDAGVKERIEAHLDHAASGRLARYFFGPKPSTGRRFERFAGGGDRPEVAHHFTAEDFVAVSMLSVQIAGASASCNSSTEPSLTPSVTRSTIDAAVARASQSRPHWVHSNVRQPRERAIRNAAALRTPYGGR